MIFGCLLVLYFVMNHFCACPRQAQSPHKRALLSPTENTAPALPEMPGLESSLYICNLGTSLCSRCYKNMYLYVFIIKYIHSSQSADIQLILL